MKPTTSVMYAIDGLPWRLPKIGGTMFAALYAAMAVMFVVPLLWQPKLGWLTLWPAVACGIVAVGYAWAGPAVYRRSNGQLTWPARWVLAPVLAGHWIRPEIRDALQRWQRSIGDSSTAQSL
jgi:hypothetical protein